jgi:hypothetical protein
MSRNGAGKAGNANTDHRDRIGAAAVCPQRGDQHRGDVAGGLADRAARDAFPDRHGHARRGTGGTAARFLGLAVLSIAVLFWLPRHFTEASMHADIVLMVVVSRIIRALLIFHFL